MTNAVLDRKTTPAAFADEDARKATADKLATLGEVGWTRPAIRAALDSLDTPLTDSAVYRAQRHGMHFREAGTWSAFFAAVDEGKVSPPEKATRLNAKTIVDNARKAAKVLADLGDKPNNSQMRAAIAAIAELLPAPKADEKVDEKAGDEPKGDEPKDDAKADEASDTSGGDANGNGQTDGDAGGQEN
jgi:hypothetical protein